MDTNRNRSLGHYTARNRRNTGNTGNMSTEGIKWEPVPSGRAALRELVVAELRAIKPAAYETPGLWLGINYECASASLPDVGALVRHPDRPFLVHMDEFGWKKNLPIFPTLGFGPPSMIELHDGVAENKSVMVEHLLGKDKHCVVRYWGLEIEDNCGEGGDKGRGDPRAQLLCEALSEHTFPYPYHFIYAQIARITPTLDEAHSHAAQPADEPSTFTGMKKGFLEALPQPAGLARPPSLDDLHQNARSGGEDVPPTCWKDVEVAPEGDDAYDPADMRAQADKLRSSAQQRANLGDHKTAYAMATDAIALQMRASRSEQTMAIPSANCERPPSPPPRTGTPSPQDAPEHTSTHDSDAAPCSDIDVRKSYFPEAQYIYPNGSVRTVPAGMYTQDEFIVLTMEEQGRLSDAVETHANHPLMAQD